ncbi:MAG TPA: hypothetical protein VFU46_07440 [Gemmatimonadales bacterium]|nr:hypothetical protein [Gemmatimonadales bacterium]
MRSARFALALALSCPALAAAQVGHPPASSPYRDIRQGSSLTFLGGRFMGNGGDVGVGPNTGWTYGGRFDLRAGRAVSLGLGLSSGQLERLIVDPFEDDPAQRASGPVDQRVTFAEALITLNLTGGKTWNHFAPFVGLVAGLGFSSDVPADTSGYEFGTKFFFAPAAGTRIFFGGRVHLRAEFRANFWKLNYPLSFRQEPDPVIITGADSEWDLSPWILVGLGYTL